MTDKQHTEYEQFVQAIYQTLLDGEGVNTITVKHNIKLQGRSGCRHQIDVYWEFEKAGVTHRVAVECKHYRSKVEIGKLRDFFGVINDLSSVKGIFVTTVGYDKGAIKFADTHDIDLKEIRIPTSQDWAGRIKDVVATITGYFTRVTSCNINLDNEKLVENGNLGANESQSLGLFAWSNEVFIYNTNEHKRISLFELIQKLPCSFREQRGVKHKYEFIDSYLIAPEIGKAKINFIELTYDVVSTRLTATTVGEELGKAIIKDVRTGTLRLLDNHGGIR